MKCLRAAVAVLLSIAQAVDFCSRSRVAFLRNQARNVLGETCSSSAKTLGVIDLLNQITSLSAGITA